ncbi:hypothetical protein K438DRAFT_921354 [Mycena galopus ATCC 62051]|nr:hypothetical protein K438DRAFT_921354 [Mycena galopus ATCC 62051]
MDSENAPLLLNHEHEGNVAHGNHANTGRSQAEHLCSSCSGNLDSRKTSQTTLRHVLIFAAFLWCIVIFSLLVAHMAVGEKPTVFTVFVAIWTHVTLAVLIVLLCMGRRRHSHHKLGRTVTQIRVLCALGVSWTLLMAGIITLNTDADAMCRSYGWRYNSYTSDDCRKLFYAAHAFSWVLIVTCTLAVSNNTSSILHCLTYLCFQCSQRHTQLILGLSLCMETPWSSLRPLPWFPRGVSLASPIMKDPRAKGL